MNFYKAWALEKYFHTLTEACKLGVKGPIQKKNMSTELWNNEMTIHVLIDKSSRQT